MTVDDECSVYVGGIPYDSTEDSLCKIFNIYGSVVAVKIINDRSTRGKCYAFITFTNPRSAIDAINDMDGRTIEGRVVRVNEVKSRGGRLGFSRDSFRHDNDRGMDRSRGGDRDRDHDYDKDRHWDRYEERPRERDRSRDNDVDTERGHLHTRDQDRARDHLVDRDRELGRAIAENEHPHNLDLNEEHDMNVDGRREDHDDDEQRGKRKGSDLDDYYDREISPSSVPYDQAKEQLDLAIQQREGLQAEIARIEGKLDENQEHVSNLKKKSKKLEDSLTAAKKLMAQRKMQLSKLHKCYLRMRDYSEKLKHCEQDLQSLIDSAIIDNDIRDDAGLRHGVLINGDV